MFHLYTFSLHFQLNTPLQNFAMHFSIEGNSNSKNLEWQGAKLIFFYFEHKYLTIYLVKFYDFSITFSNKFNVRSYS